MSIMIEIASTEIKSRSGISARTGNAYSMREQIGYLHKGEIYPERIKITLEDNQTPYAIGKYDLSTASFYVDKFDAVAVRPVLIPRINEAAKIIPRSAP
jgi:hypothetical protein